jgi:predicted kinase
MPKLLLIRGVPGTGKSTHAKHYVDEYSYTHLEADMYFERDGDYAFKREQLGAAHAWCQAECERAMQHKENIVVSNTFCTYREMEPYLRMAKRHNYAVRVVSLTHEYGSIHNVPEDAMMRFRARWQA